ncbi:MAG: hypothetical protein KAX19_03535, partial [Candidatus Brocadiae bacterium]|nr:hypothetical protein [Candidatus Brocadiia bacterium]
GRVERKGRCWPYLSENATAQATGFEPVTSGSSSPPRSAQAAMRHSSLDITKLARPGENVYTDPSLLDVAGARPRIDFDGPATIMAPTFDVRFPPGRPDG